jgi:hypothetical protein
MPTNWAGEVSMTSVTSASILFERAAAILNEHRSCLLALYRLELELSSMVTSNEAEAIAPLGSPFGEQWAEKESSSAESPPRSLP